MALLFAVAPPAQTAILFRLPWLPQLNRPGFEDEADLSAARNPSLGCCALRPAPSSHLRCCSAWPTQIASASGCGGMEYMSLI
ncbi:hypothetical protein LX32DRAFT_237856 [Colletotrichum zoysiae]|uniref:Uncharacterized protein n=1 Tax=Colletotrichum zoysiae TaxID=1216348 RepID=A0AAD9HN92_9PEZI|nr:hypothetical protein LX32DRAFT_237856 [Colletotrichum zoysiae]